jgi:hypothetical protein
MSDAGYFDSYFARYLPRYFVRYLSRNSDRSLCCSLLRNKHRPRSRSLPSSYPLRSPSYNPSYFARCLVTNLPSFLENCEEGSDVRRGASYAGCGSAGLGTTAEPNREREALAGQESGGWMRTGLAALAAGAQLLFEPLHPFVNAIAGLGR